ncbi:MAG: hypothetical protein EOP81_11415 [Variovorax sp.]|nr:MAG: hypothetical protein EOP81_11415 [Variovorax sp.]
MDEIVKHMVSERRTALQGNDDGHRPWGLALSGGGIRSATFCLGLLKALAQRRQLLRFDLMSTVSGGGYAAAALGRLCTRATSADDVRAVEGAFAEIDKVRFGWWLRGNGRYLIPGGMRDTLFAVALYLRNLLGTHIEIAIAACLIGLGLAAVNLGLWEAVARAVDIGNGTVVMAPVRWATALPTLWLALLLPWAVSIVLACAYWSVRDRPSLRGTVGMMAMWSALAAGGFVWGAELEQHYGAPPWLAPAFMTFATAWVVALGWLLGRTLRGHTPAVLRNELTDSLASMFHVALLIVVLGALDWSAWWLAAESRQTRASYGGVLLVAAAALRGVMPMFFSGKSEVPGIGQQLLMTLASLLGLVVAFCLAAWWIGVLYAGVLLPIFTPGGLDFSRGWIWLATILVIVGSYAVVTGRQFSFLNLSSLHMFYKARIVRGYLGAANAERLGASPLDGVAVLATPEVPVGAVHAGDDLPQDAYAPHKYGGPVHLMNVCINQTHDPKQKLFNRDRKSLPLTVGPRGWMQPAGAPWKQVTGERAMSLGTWSAISGAAFAPGLGRFTKRGIAALSVFAGLRLGYWWDSAKAGLVQHDAAVRVRRLLMKTRFLLAECFGAFPGSGSPVWYLSDGGHFENTGAYALLRQEAELIVVADCGADPDYRFSDLEILIRRARIDLHADIVFLKPCCDGDWAYAQAFGSLNDLASTSSQACLALARIDYASGLRGHLLLVKPNVSAELPVDLVNFKAANPLFPQQSTTDQFFDEAQWESYFRLGSEIGRRLEGPMLSRIVQDTRGLFVPDDGQAGLARGTGSAAGATAALDGAVASVSRLQARVLKASAVTASIGLGAAATFGVAAWQGIDSWRTQMADKQRAESLAFKDLTERWSRLRVNAPPGEAPSSLAGELLRTGDLLCRQGSDNFMANFRLSVRIVDDAKTACREELARANPAGETGTASPVGAGGAAGSASAVPAKLGPSPACARLLDAENGIDCLQAPVARACAPRYWGHDYSGRTGSQHNCIGQQPGIATFFGAMRQLVIAPFAVRFRNVEMETMVDAAPAAAAAPAAPGAAAAPSAAVADPAAPRVTPGPQSCQGVRVYTQIFGPADSAAAEGFRAPWRAIGATVPPIEDVLASARRAGRAPPQGHPAPTILFHSADLQRCAEALAQTARPPAGRWVVKALPVGLKAQPGTVEVWLPRAALYETDAEARSGR